MAILVVHSSRNLKCEDPVPNAVCKPFKKLNSVPIVGFPIGLRRLKKGIDAKTGNGLNGIREPL
jgi:hypothetical protein